MINTFAEANITEQNIDFALYSIQSALDDAFALMEYARHNEPELFLEYISIWKETEATMLEYASRIKGQEKMVKLEALMMGGGR